MNASCAASSASAGDPTAAIAARYTAAWCLVTRSPNAWRSPCRASATSSASVTQTVDIRARPTVGQEVRILELGIRNLELGPECEIRGGIRNSYRERVKPARDRDDRTPVCR